MEEKVLIFGHKNPDTDTICSSIVQERLNKKNGWNSTNSILDILRERIGLI